MQEIQVIKRNGQKVPFDKNKIYNAVCKAVREVYPDSELLCSKIPDIVANSISDKITQDRVKKINIEIIQDMVEYALMEEDKDIAKAYITYRYKRALARNDFQALMKIVKEKLYAENVANQNANVDEYSFGGRKGEVSNEVMKMYALEFILSKKSRENHLNNRIYIHDLSEYALGDHNCLSVPFDDLFSKNINTRQTDIRPPRSVSAAFQLVAVYFQLQSLQQFGGVSATHLDWTMVPLVRLSFAKYFRDGLKYLSDPIPIETKEEYLNKLNDIIKTEFSTNSVMETIENTISIEDNFYKDIPEVYEYAMDMLKKEIHQSVEALYHNLNTLQSRSGNQLPFSSINFGTCTLPEGRLIIKALLEGLIDGVGSRHSTSVFPCVIFQSGKGINQKEGDPNYDLFRLALKATSFRIYPNYCNIDWTGNKGYDPKDPRTYMSTMGCRTVNGYDINGFGQLKDGRGNICPVTIILPTLAMEAYEETKDDPEKRVDCFMDKLVTAINDAKDMLLERYEYICSQKPESAKFMYENGLMAGYDGKDIRSALKHGTLAIGQLGLAETLQILIGCDHTEEKGMELAKKIESTFRTMCDEFKKEYKLNFGVYLTPAENLSYTAMKKLQSKYGEIPNVSDKDFFTNSIHVPVWKEMTPFEKIDIESQLTGYSNAGCITYVELDASAVNNIDALETIVLYAMDNDIPYFGINVPNDMCMDCGFTYEINDKCPKCGGTNIRRLRRVTGYLTGDYKTAFNLGKQQETEMRVKHC